MPPDHKELTYTHTPLPVVTPDTEAGSNALLPLPVVTEQTETNINTPLLVVTTSSSLTPCSMYEPHTSAPLPVVTHPTEPLVVSTPPEPPADVDILKKTPLVSDKSMPAASGAITAIEPSIPLPVVMETPMVKVTTTPPFPVVTPLPDVMHDHPPTVFEVLTPEQDELVSIPMQDIMSRRCTVDLDKLNVKDVQDIKTYLKGEEVKPTEKTMDSAETEELPMPLLKKKKRPSHRPGRKASKDRLRAQKHITARNKKIRNKEIVVPPIKPLTDLKISTDEPTPAEELKQTKIFETCNSTNMSTVTRNLMSAQIAKKGLGSPCKNLGTSVHRNRFIFQPL